MRNKKAYFSIIILILLFIASCDYSPFHLRKKLFAKFRDKTDHKAWQKKNYHSHHIQSRKILTINEIKKKLEDANPKLNKDLLQKLDNITTDSEMHIFLIENSKIVVPASSFPIADDIHCYTNMHSLPFPQYFIISSSQILSLLNNNPKYIHFYLCNNDTTNNPDLVMIGADSTSTDSHTSDSIVDKKPFINPSITDTVYSDFTSSNICGIVPDDNFEGAYNYVPYPQIKLPNNIPWIPFEDATKRINEYDTNMESLPITMSFVIDTQGFRNFLLNTNYQYNINHPGDKDPKYAAHFIQVYLAYKSCYPDSASVIIVGLDNLGNHVYYTTDMAPANVQVFDMSTPCPYCGVDADILNVLRQQ